MFLLSKLQMSIFTLSEDNINSSCGLLNNSNGREFQVLEIYLPVGIKLYSNTDIEDFVNNRGDKRGGEKARPRNSGGFRWSTSEEIQRVQRENFKFLRIQLPQENH